jgi:hypothetical protein
MQRSSFFNLFFSVVIPVILVVAVVLLIMGADSIEVVVFGR